MTFADLGIPFPLWEAPIECASDYAGLQACSLCHTENQHCFCLNDNDDVMARCPACQAENGLNAGVRLSEPCVACGAKVPFPLLTVPQVENKILVCYFCLRDGRAAIVKDTALGMIDWENARKGQTHGVPGLDRTDVELVPVDDDWIAARLEPILMWELLRTPNYITWQGEQWQFGEGQPMIYVGEWNRGDFNKNAPNGDGKALFDEIVPAPYEGQWDNLSNAQSCVYVFRSATRQKWAAHWDMD